MFRPDRATARRPAEMDRRLRASLREVGRIGDVADKLRETLLGISRVSQFTQANAGWMQPDQRARFDTLRGDITSLNDFESHLFNKIQFLLDATVGLIGIEQANIVKVLTVVSVVGIPPTFIASMYGMNFQLMPELNWNWGYPYALALMLLSAVLPLVWFRVKGWM